MRPSTPHYTSPADLREMNTNRIQTGIADHGGFCRGGAIRGFMFAVLFEGIIALVAVALWYAFR